MGVQAERLDESGLTDKILIPVGKEVAALRSQRVPGLSVNIASGSIPQYWERTQ
jgi:hypothetical protein